MANFTLSTTPLWDEKTEVPEGKLKRKFLDANNHFGKIDRHEFLW
jgi:hypothetical protein